MSYGDDLYQALKPPTPEQVERFMDGANREYAKRVMGLPVPEKRTAYRDASGGVQFREDPNG